MQQDLLTANERAQEALMEEVKKLIKKSRDFYELITTQIETIIASLYNGDYTTKENKTKAVKVNRKLIQKLVNSLLPN